MSNYVPLTPIGGPAGQPLPPQQSFPPPPPKKSNVKVWVLAGCGTFIVIGVIAVFLAGEVVYIKSGTLVKYGTEGSVIRSIRDAGLDRMGLPGWFPSYPGAGVHGTFSTESKDGEGARFGFSTNDSIEKVVKFYEENLKQAGLKVTTNTVQQNGVVSKGSLASEDGDKKRTAFVTAISEKGQTQVTVVFASK